MSDETTTGDAQAPETGTVESVLKAHGLADDTVAKLKDEFGVATVDDLSQLTEADLVDAGIKKVPARKLLAALQPATPVADATALGAAAFDAILPTVPDDGAWLTALKAGGVRKVDQSTVISAIRAALANRVGLYKVPDRLAKEMERFADQNDEPVPTEFYALRKQLTRRNYAEVFEAIDGLDGNFVNDTRKQQLFERVDQHLWPAILAFYDQLKSWQETWVQQGASPAMLMTVLATGGAGAPLPPGMMQPPDTAILRDYAETTNDAINRVFAGTGVQIAAALAYEATQIRQTLEDPRLPSLIGAANRDQMLKQLGVAVSSTYPRLETNLTRFVLAIMQADTIPAGNEELQYFGTLYMLGSQIQGELDGRRGTAVTGIGGRTQL